MVNKVYLEDLPKFNRLNKSNGEYAISWSKCIGSAISFDYNNINGVFEIIDYDKKSKLKVLYNNEIKEITTECLLNCNLGKLTGFGKGSFRIEINTLFEDTHRSFLITNRYKIIDDTNIERKYYNYKCNICGWDKGIIDENSLLKGVGCSCCHGNTAVEGINSIVDVAPWMIKYFQGGYDEAKLYTPCSAKKIYPICPECGRIKTTPMPIHKIYNRRSIGCFCGDGYSFPEKFIYNFLEQSQINFIYQLSKTTFDWCGKYKYDFFIPEYNIILEVNGKQHISGNGFSTFKNGKTLQEQKNIDKIKKNLALLYVDDYIDLNCENSNLYCMQQSIISAGLFEILKINKSSVDLNKCLEFATSSRVKEACDLKKEYYSDIDISNKMRLHLVTIKNYLKRGHELGWLCG